MSARALLVGLGLPDDEHRVDAAGRVVIPAADEDEAEALGRVASRFGVAVIRTEGVRADPEPGEGRPVVPLDAGAQADASLYARLTGRPLGSVRDPLGGHASVYVGSSGPPTPDVLERLYDPAAEGPAPGLVWGHSAAALRRNVKLAAAAAAIQFPALPQVTLINPDVPRGTMRMPGRVMMGGASTADEVRAAFANGTGATAIVTHSDGVDGGLGRGLLVCAMDQPSPDADPGRAPRCAATGICHRLQRPVGEVIGSADVVHPDAMASPILVWGACFGVMAPAGPMDPRFGLADRFLANPELGVVVTAWEVAYVLPPLIQMALQALQMGASVGQTVSWLNRSPAASSRRFRLCILGDPEIRLMPPGAAPVRLPPPPVQPLAPPDPDPRGPADLAELAYARLMLGVTRPTRDGAPGIEACDAALAATHALEVAWFRGDHVEAGDRFRRHLHDYVVERGPLLYHGWSAAAQTRALDDSPVCPTCRDPHHRLVRYRCSFAGDGAAARVVSFCPACSVVEDAPQRSPPLWLRWADGGFELEGERPPRAWLASLVLIEQGNMGKHVMSWPADVDGRPAPRLVPEVELPRGPVDAVLVLTSGWDLVIKAQKTMMHENAGR